MSGAMPAARVGDPIAHSNAGLGMALGVLAGVVAGAVLVGATVATGGAALAVVAAVGGAAALTSFGGLKGMAIGGASMGPPTGALAIGSVNVLINTRPATMTAMASALCTKDPGPIPLATGASTVLINACMAGREGETMACSAKVVAACSPNVIIGGPSAQDPWVTITPEVPPWAVTSLQVLGVVGAVMALPFSVAALGVGGTIAAGVLGAGGSFLGGKAMRALAESMGMSEAGVLTMEAFGELGGGMLGGAAGARRFGTKPKSPPAAPQPAKPVSYDRPTSFRKGVRDKAWDAAKGPDGQVRDPKTNQIMNKSDPWDISRATNSGNIRLVRESVGYLESNFLTNTTSRVNIDRKLRAQTDLTLLKRQMTFIMEIDVDKELARGVYINFCRVVGANEKSVLRHWDEPEENFVDVVTCNNIYEGAETRVASTVSLSNHPLYLNGEIYPVRVEFVMLAEPKFEIMENALATAAFAVIKDGFFPRPGAVIFDVMNIYQTKTKLPNIYLTDPFPWGDALHSTRIGDFDVTWLLAFPISESESNYIDKEGDEKFESLLEEHAVNVFDYDRDPFI